MIYEANKRIYQKLKTIKLEKKAEKKLLAKKKIYTNEVKVRKLLRADVKQNNKSNYNVNKKNLKKLSMKNTCTFNYKGSCLQYKKRKIGDVTTKPTIFEQKPVEPKKNRTVLQKNLTIFKFISLNH